MTSSIAHSDNRSCSFAYAPLSIVWSPDGQYVAVAYSQSIEVLFAPTLEPRFRLECPNDIVRSVRFVGRERLVAATNAGKLYVFDAFSGETLGCLQVHSKMIVSLDVRGTLVATASADGTVRLTSCASFGSSVSSSAERMWHGTRSFFASSAAMLAVAYLPGRTKIATAGCDNVIRIFELTRNSRSELGNASSPSSHYPVTRPPVLSLAGPVNATAKLIGHHDWISCLAPCGDGRWLASGSFDRSIRLWDLQTEQCVTSTTLPDPVTSLAWLDADRLVVSAGCHLYVLNRTTGRVVEIATHAAAISSLAVCPGARDVASAGWDNKVRLTAISHTTASNTSKSQERLLAVRSHDQAGSELRAG